MRAFNNAPATAPVVQVGDTAVTLYSNSADFFQLVESRYRPFLHLDSRRGVDLHISLTGADDPEIQDIHVSKTGGSFCAERGDFCLHWNPADTSGTLALALKPYSLDAALRVLHTFLLAQQHGFLLHAASAIRNGRSHLFFGPSGVGKTTIARLAPPNATLLTDEISYIRRNGTQYFAYGTPFTGELAKLGENTSAPIAALYRLTKASTNRLTLLPQPEAARALLENILFFAEDSKLVNLVFESVCDLVCQVSVYQLDFVPDHSVWDVIQ